MIIWLLKSRSSSTSASRRPASGKSKQKSTNEVESSGALFAKKDLEDAITNIEKKNMENKALKEDLNKISDSKEKLALQLRMAYH